MTVIAPEFDGWKKWMKFPLWRHWWSDVPLESTAQVPGTFSHQLKFTRIGMHAEYTMMNNGPMRLTKCMKNDALSRVIFPTRGFQLKVKAQCDQKEKGIFFSRAHFLICSTFLISHRHDSFPIDFYRISFPTNNASRVGLRANTHARGKRPRDDVSPLFSPNFRRPIS